MPHWLSYTSYSVHFDGSDMTADETEFILAVASYQKRFRRRYPTWLEVLHIAHCLGYRMVAEPVPISEPVPPLDMDEAKSEVQKSKFEKGDDWPR
jgi:hypothetical protein